MISTVIQGFGIPGSLGEKLNKKLILLPQLNRVTGLSVDYLCELAKIKYLLPNIVDENFNRNKLRVRKYLEVYSPNLYKEVITRRNKNSIRDLDQIVIEINGLNFPEDFESYTQLYEGAYKIITGRAY